MHTNKAERQEVRKISRNWIARPLHCIVTSFVKLGLVQTIVVNILIQKKSKLKFINVRSSFGSLRSLSAQPC